MPLTPADVANKQFKIAFRGYSLDEVDSFLDDVEAELGRLLRENNDLRTGQPAAPAFSHAVEQPAAAPTPAAPAAPAPLAPGEGQEAALRTLLLAQRTADEVVAEARAEGAALVAAAQRRAEGVDAEIAARIAAAMGGLDERKRELEIQIEDLRAFEREYRTRLKAYLEGQLRDLSARGAPDDGGAGVPAAARSAAVGLGQPVPPYRPAEPPATPPPATQPTPPTAATPQPAPPAAPPAPVGPPREADGPGLRSVPPLQSAGGPDPIGPFTIVPPTTFSEQLDDGPEHPDER